ncbi:rRNA maturation RNase YbeY [uncultured Croceitalea sp.]|uniref:rRNA maturation RNase YbeY n=1 Tax=uncultured Croceitalea sp. TaxID=1798908 RepID=UPI00374F6B20
MKIEFNYETDFSISNESDYSDWITRIIRSEDSVLGNLNYIFCDDNYLSQINLQYLNHDTLTDIITFDYSEEAIIAGDIFISIDRVKENAQDYNVTLEEELNRVMSHGVLHLLGYEDKTESGKNLMREKENEMMGLFHVEQ